MRIVRVKADQNLKVIGLLLNQKKRTEKTVLEATQESIAKITEWGKTNRYCPKCHRLIYKKQLENENGTYYLYGHTDFKTGDCSYTTYDFADLLENYQLPNDT